MGDSGVAPREEGLEVVHQVIQKTFERVIKICDGDQVPVVADSVAEEEHVVGSVVGNGAVPEANGVAFSTEDAAGGARESSPAVRETVPAAKEAAVAPRETVSVIEHTVEPLKVEDPVTAKVSPDRKEEKESEVAIQDGVKVEPSKVAGAVCDEIKDMTEGVKGKASEGPVAVPEEARQKAVGSLKEEATKVVHPTPAPEAADGDARGANPPKQVVSVSEEANAKAATEETVEPSVRVGHPPEEVTMVAKDEMKEDTAKKTAVPPKEPITGVGNEATVEPNVEDVKIAAKDGELKDSAVKSVAASPEDAKVDAAEEMSAEVKAQVSERSVEPPKERVCRPEEVKTAAIDAVKEGVAKKTAAPPEEAKIGAVKEVNTEPCNEGVSHKEDAKKSMSLEKIAAKEAVSPVEGAERDVVAQPNPGTPKEVVPAPKEQKTDAKVEAHAKVSKETASPPKETKKTEDKKKSGKIGNTNGVRELRWPFLKPSVPPACSVQNSQRSQSVSSSKESHSPTATEEESFDGEDQKMRHEDERHHAKSPSLPPLYDRDGPSHSSNVPRFMQATTAWKGKGDESAARKGRPTKPAWVSTTVSKKDATFDPSIRVSQIHRGNSSARSRSATPPLDPTLPRFMQRTTSVMGKYGNDSDGSTGRKTPNSSRSSKKVQPKEQRRATPTPFY